MNISDEKQRDCTIPTCVKQWSKLFESRGWPVITTVISHNGETVKQGYICRGKDCGEQVPHASAKLLEQLNSELDKAAKVGANAWLENWPLSLSTWIGDDGIRHKVSYRGCPTILPDGFDIERARIELAENRPFGSHRYGDRLTSAIQMSCVPEGGMYPTFESAKTIPVSKIVEMYQRYSGTEATPERAFCVSHNRMKTILSWWDAGQKDFHGMVMAFNCLRPSMRRPRCSPSGTTCYWPDYDEVGDAKRQADFRVGVRQLLTEWSSFTLSLEDATSRMCDLLKPLIDEDDRLERSMHTPRKALGIE